MLHTETEVTCPSSRSARQSEACDPPAQPRARGLFGCPCVLSRGTRPPGQEGRESGSLGQLPELKRINPVWTSGGLCPRVPPQAHEAVSPGAAEGLPSLGPRSAPTHRTRLTRPRHTTRRGTAKRSAAQDGTRPCPGAPGRSRAAGQPPAGTERPRADPSNMAAACPTWLLSLRNVARATEERTF